MDEIIRGFFKSTLHNQKTNLEEKSELLLG
jgi:hypothetical protein